MRIRCRATYGGQGCIADPEGSADASTFTVFLDKDPGYGSMIFTRIGRSLLVLGEEIPEEGPPEPGPAVNSVHSLSPRGVTT